MDPPVEVAVENDLEAWLGLAREVGELFGANMADDPRFRANLQRKLGEGETLCVRIDGTLAGGMLFGEGTIKWLAVRKRFQRRGVGRALVAHAQSSARELHVTTFGAEHAHPDAQASRALYRAMGFVAASEGGVGPDGSPRETLVWSASSSDDSEARRRS